MKTTLRIERADKVYTYDLDAPLLPEGTLLYTPVVAACRIVHAAIIITKDEKVEQSLVAR